MAEIIKALKEAVPAMGFIGKKDSEFGHCGDLKMVGSAL